MYFGFVKPNHWQPQGTIKICQATPLTSTEYWFSKPHHKQPMGTVKICQSHHRQPQSTLKIYQTTTQVTIKNNLWTCGKSPWVYLYAFCAVGTYFYEC